MAGTEIATPDNVSVEEIKAMEEIMEFNKVVLASEIEWLMEECNYKPSDKVLQWLAAR